MENKEQAKWNPAEIEYRRVDEALRARMNLTPSRNAYILATSLNEMQKLIFTVEYDAVVWSCVRTYYSQDQDAKIRINIDKKLKGLRDAAYKLVEDGHENTREDGSLQIDSDDITRIRAFLDKEEYILWDILDLRHEKGLDIGMKREWTEKERSKTIKGIADESFGD
jgi:hypothetical protein